jgi:hypothetical protein
LGEDAFVEKIEKTLTKKREKKYLITYAWSPFTTDK